MKIKRVKFRGFGRWINQEFEFQDGINLIEAPNEAGKSTLLHGIYGLMFGEKKEGLKKRKEADWYDSFKPWQSSEYGGEIDYEYQEQLFRLYRSFAFPDSQEQLVDLKTGEDLSALYTMNKQKDRQFVEKQIGLSGEAYRRVGIFTSGMWTQISKRKEEDHSFHQKMVERMTKLLKNGANPDGFSALESLDQQLEAIGKSEYARHKPYGVECERERTLKQEVITLQEVRHQLQINYEQRSDITKQIEVSQHQIRECLHQIEQIKQKVADLRELEVDVQQLEYLYKSKAQLEQRLDQWRLLEQQILDWRREQQEVAATREISTEFFQEVQLLYKQSEELRKKLAQARDELSKVSEHLEVARTRKEQMSSVEKDRASIMLSKLDDFKAGDLRYQALQYVEEEEEQQKFTQINHDLEQLGILQDEQNQLHEKKTIAHQEFLKMKTQHTQKKESSVPWLLASIVTLAIPGGFAFFHWGLGLGALVIPLLLLWQYRRIFVQDRSRKKTEQHQKKRMQVVLEDLDHQLQENTQQQKQIMQVWRVRSLTDLLLKREEIQGSLNQSMVQTIERRNLEIQLEERKQEIEEWMKKHIRPVPEFSVSSWKEAIRNLQKQEQRAEDQYRLFQMKSEALDREITEKSEEREQIELSLEQKYLEFGVSTFGELESWYERHKHLIQLHWQIQEAEKRYEVWSKQIQEENCLDQWKNQRVQIREIQSKYLGEVSLLQDRYRDWEYELAKAEEQQRDREHVRETQQMELVRLDKTLEDCEEQLARLPLVESEWESSKNRILELEEERTILELAKQALEESSRQFQEDLSPRLTPHASRWIRTITQNRYQALNIDPKEGIQLSVFVPETGERKSVEHLSTGTIDQMYLALRFALLQFYSEMTRTRLPLILDDCFVHFDQDRLSETLQLLHQFSQEHQVILCTCQTRERELLNMYQLPHHSITLSL
ncbi:DNA repair exonuclease SbcCD ATPase subunit [Croceifilum oryzae]|uniref:DNA repair exonuclease SbcCD ATPase subunit n=1 Tax=Croceifilum oryzae TaxID=1553429 RepID=A0AAJ1TKG5_9BACL|nr:AAA family ATPase [Croceifilum oryzae]MDQ0417756.1 DNA repair exonuclease SbcCD ATPase subunit [Croceifilum oryzae]